MTHYSAFTRNPSLIGFDSLFKHLETVGQREQSYPPYNIIKTDEDSFDIELAVAGYSEADIDIEVNQSVLNITGTTPEKEDVREYMHKGISARKFKQTFTLAQYVEVEGADFVNGILSIHLARKIPDEKKPRKIAISSPQLLLEE